MGIAKSPVFPNSRASLDTGRSNDRGNLVVTSKGLLIFFISKCLGPLDRSHMRHTGLPAGGYHTFPDSGIHDLLSSPESMCQTIINS